MSYIRLFVFLEGDDDERLFDAVLRPSFNIQYNLVQTIKYAGLKSDKVDSYLTSIKGMGANYLFLTDMDQGQCVSSKKSELVGRYRKLNESNIHLVIREIESWYLAGITNANAKKIKLATPGTTDSITKEAFYGLKARRFVSRIDFMVELLSLFSVPAAIANNRSFKHFMDANGLPQSQASIGDSLPL